MALNIGELFGRITFDTSGAMSALEAVEAQVAAIGAVAGVAFGAAAKAGVDFASKMQQAEIGLTTMLGSTEAAQKQLEDLKRFAAATPFEMDGLLQSQNRLMAMGFAANDVIPMLTGVGDAVAAMGGGSDKVDLVTLAMSQMQAKGKATAQEMNQLLETGTYSWAALAETMGVSIDEAMKQVEKRTVSATTVINSFMANSYNRFGGMMEAQSKTYAGQLSTFSDTVKQTLGDVFLPVMNGATQALAAFNGLNAGTQATIVKFSVLASGGTAAAASLSLMAKQAQIMGPALLQMAKASAPAAAGWLAVAAGIAGVILVIGAAERAMESMGTSWGEVLSGMWDTVKTWIGTYFSAWDKYFTWWRDRYIEVAEMIGLLSSAQASGLKQGTAFGDVGSFLDTLGQSVKDNIADPIVDSFTTGLDVIGGGISSLMDQVIGKAATAASKMASGALVLAGGDATGSGSGLAGITPGDPWAVLQAKLDAIDTTGLQDTVGKLDDKFRALAAGGLAAMVAGALDPGIGGVMAAGKDGAEMGQFLGVGAALGAATFGIGALIASSTQFAEAQAVLAEGFQGLADGAGALIRGLMPVFKVISDLMSVLGNALAPAFRALGEMISNRITPYVDALGPILEVLGIIFGGLGDAFGNLAGLMDGPMKIGIDVFAEAMKIVAGVMLSVVWLIGKVWNAIIDAIYAVVNVFVGKNADILDKLEGMKMDMVEIDEAFASLGSTTTQLAAAQEEAANVTARLAASAAETAASLTSVPQAFKVALARYTSMESVPAFASGGYVTGPTLAMIGEGGEPEFVVPESKMAALLAGGGGGGITIGQVVVQASSMRQMLSEITKEANRQGMAVRGRRASASPFLGRS